MQINTLADLNVRVIPTRYVKEYRGTTAVKSREVPESDWGVVTNLDAAILTQHATDAHFQALQVPGASKEGDRYPRVGRAWALNLWKDDDVPPDALPVFRVVVLDLDHGDKTTTWSERAEQGYTAADAAFVQLVTVMRARYGCAHYLSRTGARLFALLPEPLTVDVYEDFVARWLVDMDKAGLPVFTPDAHGHHIDASCFDLGRLFKLPLVKGSHPDKAVGLGLDWYNPTFAGTLGFKAGALLPWTFGRRKGGVGRPTTPAPSEPRTFNKTDLTDLRGRDFWDVLTRPEPIGPPGGRHNPMIQIAGAVAKALNTTDPAVVYAVLYPSVKASVTPEDREADVLSELWEIAHYVAAGVEADQEAAQELKAATGSARNAAYGRIAELTGCDPAQAPRRVILATNKGVYYPFDEDLEAYAPVPYRLQQLAQAAAKHCPNLVQLRTDTGGFVADRTLALKHSSSDVSEVRYVYGARDVRADLTNRRLYLPACSVRDDLTPRYHEQVARWLALLGGPHHDDLLNWLALYPDLKRPLCALYLQGEKGTGKGVLARALASLFGAEPVKYEILGERFQSPLLASPLLLADESVQLGHFRAGHGTSIFRTILGSGSHQVEEKGMDHVWVEGFVRVIVAANNTDALKIREDLSAEDVGAIQERVGYIEVPKDAASKFIADLSWDEVATLIDRAVPEHVLYLQKTRPLTPELRRSRFASWASSFARTVKLDIGATRLVAEVLGRWFERLQTLADPDQGLFVKDGLLYVRTTQLNRMWKSVVDDGANRLPGSKALTTALRALAPEDMSEPNASVRIDDKVLRAWAVDPDKVAAVLDGLDVDVERFRATFNLDAHDAPAPGALRPHFADAIDDYWNNATLEDAR